MPSNRARLDNHSHIYKHKPSHAQISWGCNACSWIYVLRMASGSLLVVLSTGSGRGLCIVENNALWKMGGNRQTNREQLTTHRSIRPEFKIDLKSDLDTPNIYSSCRMPTTISCTQTCQVLSPSLFTSHSDSIRGQELYILVHQFIAHNMLWQAQGIIAMHGSSWKSHCS